MFAFRIFIVLVFASAVTPSVEAQLFRFRANANYDARGYAKPQYGYPSGYDADAYRYTQVQPRATYVPSQRYAMQAQTPPCYRNQNGTTYAQQAAQQQQQQNQQRTASANPNQAASQTQVVVVTYRDPYSGRLYQRQYRVPQPQAPANREDSTSLAANKADNDKDAPTTPISTANQIGVSTPGESLLLNAGKVATTSFESPASADESGVEYSILSTPDSGSESNAASNSVQETALPILELPESTPDPESPELEITGDDLNLDLPPLESDGSN
ncbi:hypothetical protein [Mariniblastus fucicola]|uniref:Uncharacterized protein n=1 Tax=Mariniblastus fucicola TaxID=980251 RepID=A0A5B9PAI1_9BACT|nr:hypothetical protein [Mariniblastus fucicola]QEG22499.1 hypothetical protein MFFC18_23800 [Mariniblastus fucicola]